MYVHEKEKVDEYTWQDDVGSFVGGWSTVSSGNNNGLTRGVLTLDAVRWIFVCVSRSVTRRATGDDGFMTSGELGGSVDGV